MPLCEGHDEAGVTYYVQVGSKQLKIGLRLIVDSVALGKIVKKMNQGVTLAGSGGGGGVNNGINQLMFGLSAAVAKKVEMSKKELEF